MKKLRTLGIIILGILGLGLTLHKVIAATQYTSSQVAEHSTSSSCWVIYNTGVYDITTYLTIHNQRYSNITSWCGTDITTAYDSERKHNSSADSLLETFKIGALSSATNTTVDVTTTTTETQNTDTTESSKSTNPYNLWVPILIATILYWGHYLYAFKISKPPKAKTFNALWNTILILSFLIPTLGFGIIMILQYQVQSLAQSQFNFLYWHVELSLLMGTVGLFHFLKRARIYLAQLKNND